MPYSFLKYLTGLAKAALTVWTPMVTAAKMPTTTTASIMKAGSGSNRYENCASHSRIK